MFNKQYSVLTLQAFKQALELKSKDLLIRGSMEISIGDRGCQTLHKVVFGSTRVNYGQRAWFICGHCGRRTATLYMLADTQEFTCRQDWGLLYPSQQYHRLACYENDIKYQYKINRIKSKLENKYLRLPKKERLWAEIKELNNQAAHKQAIWFTRKFRNQVLAINNLIPWRKHV